MRLGIQRFYEGNFGLAQQYFQDAVEKSPRDVAAWTGLAASYDRLARFDLADRAYAAAAKLEGETTQLLNNEGYSYMLRGDLKAARAKFQSALRRDPNNQTTLNNIKLLNSSQNSLSAPQTGAMRKRRLQSLTTCRSAIGNCSDPRRGSRHRSNDGAERPRSIEAGDRSDCGPEEGSASELLPWLVFPRNCSQPYLSAMERRIRPKRGTIVNHDPILRALPDDRDVHAADQRSRGRQENQCSSARDAAGSGPRSCRSARPDRQFQDR